VSSTPAESTLSLAPNLYVADASTATAGRRRRSAWLKIPVLFSLAIIGFWVLVAITIPWWSPYDPVDRVGEALQPPSGSHWLGTDGLGRDVLVRTFYGTRQSMPLALLVIVVGVTIGCVLGAISGFVGGWVDSVIMRIADIMLSFPAILLAMVVTAALGKGLYHIAIAMIIVWWPIYARLLRAQILSVKEQEHVEAARAAGAGKWRVLSIHVLPLSMTPVMVNATMDFGVVVLLAAGLSYVGLGAVPPTPEWGLSINEGTLYFHQWWIAAGPGIAILSIVLAFNFLGDGLRDYLDVRMR
jgi:peptide/nickel transport system permease protein